MDRPQFEADLPLSEQRQPDSQPRPWAPHYTGWWSLVYKKDTYEEPIVVDDPVVVDESTIVDEATAQGSKGRSRSRTPPRTPQSSDGKPRDPRPGTEETTADIKIKKVLPPPKTAGKK